MTWQWKPNQRVYVTRKNVYVGRRSRYTVLVIIGIVFAILIIIYGIATVL